MKTKILVGAVAALLYGGVALADDNKDCPSGYELKDAQASLSAQEVQQEEEPVIETEPVDPSIGGAGQEGMDQDLTVEEPSVDQDLGASEQPLEDEFIGGSGRAGRGEVILRCEPVREGEGMGGSGMLEQGQEPLVGEGGSGLQTEPMTEPQVPPPAAPVSPESEAFAPPMEQEDEIVRREDRADLRGLSVTVGGGVEGYTGALAPEINPGAAFGVTAALKPTSVLGVELGYSGAVNELDSAVGDTDGPDLVRNGGHAAVTVGLIPAPIQPYLLGGIGISDYNFRGGGAGVAGFSDDTVGNVPLGVGLRTHMGNLTADLRANYNFLFDQDFVGVDDGFSENGSYAGTLNIGGTF